MADMTITLTGPLFRRQYLVYIVELSNHGSHYFYVGQTGDTKETTARPVFRRFAAHLEDRKSTQNQVYQYVAHRILLVPDQEGRATAFSVETRAMVEDFLATSDITMHAYRLEPFEPSISRTEHDKRRRRSQVIEGQIVALFRRNGREVMNQKSGITVDSTECPYPDVLGRVARDFGLEMG